MLNFDLPMLTFDLPMLTFDLPMLTFDLPPTYFCRNTQIEVDQRSTEFKIMLTFDQQCLFLAETNIVWPLVQ